MRGICGVYSIEVAGRLYVGASKNIRDRWGGHIDMLISKRHHNPNMQAVFDRDGLAAFRFRVLELCEREQLFFREQHWLDFHRGSAPSFNTSSSAVRTGSYAPGRMKGVPKTEEHKAKIGAAQRAAWERDDGTRKAVLVTRNKTMHTWRD